MKPAERVVRFLDEANVKYELIPHHKDITAGQAAYDTHTPREAFAKSVFVFVADRLAMAVLPADQLISEVKMETALKQPVRIASESEFENVCGDCELGAEPPFGNLYDLPVYVSPSLAENEQITFNAGSHREAFRMAYADFTRLVEPDVIPLARHD